MKHFGIVFPLTVIALCMGLSLVTYPYKANRGIASADQIYYSATFKFYDAHYKL